MINEISPRTSAYAHFCLWDLVRFAVVALFLFACISPAFAQFATLVGTITDASSAVVPQTTVVATKVETNVSFQAITNRVGQYEIPALDPGTYSVTAEKAGFMTMTLTGILLQVGQRGTLDISLKVGEQKQTVEVSGRTPILDLASSELGQVINPEQINTLPLNGRDFMQLALLSAGVNQGVASAWTGEQLYAANGLMGDHDNYFLDGVENRESANNGVMDSPSVDAIQEFKAETGMFSAEYQAAGLVINVVTKSGSNALHGAAYEYLRNDKLDASGYFPVTDRTKPELRRNQFGFALGGPFVKDKHFWFANYEGERQTQGSVLLGRIPTPAQIGGQFDTPILNPFTGVYFPNNQIPSNLISPVLQKILSFNPAPNISEAGENYLNTEPYTLTDDRFLIRTDHYLNARDNLAVRFSFRNDTSFTPGLIPKLSGSNVIDNTRGLGLIYHHVFSPTFLNELVLGYTRLRNDFAAEVIGNPEYTTNPGILGIGLNPNEINKVTTPFDVNVETYDELVGAQTILQVMNVYQYSDGLTWMHGKHSVKIGAAVMRNQFKSFALGTSQSGSGDYTGQFTGNPIADALLDAPADVTKQGDSPITYPRETQIGAYIQDDWRATSRFTLNLGIRYDLDLPVNDRVLAAFDPTIAGLRFPRPVIEHSGYDVTGYYATIRPDIPIEIDNTKSVYNADTNNFSPRAGFAYSLGSDQKTVVRGGVGIFFSSPPAMGIRCSATLPPFTIRFEEYSDPTVPTISLVSTGNTSAETPLRVWSFPGNRQFPNGYVEEWSLNVQRQVTPSTMIEVGYIGNHGLKNTSTLDINQDPTPGPGDIQSRRPFPSFGPIMVQGNYQVSFYKGLSIKSEKRFSHGLTFLASYQLSKTRTNADQSTSGIQQDIKCPIKCEMGYSAFDLPQRLTVSYSYALPVGKGQTVFGSRPAPLGPLVDKWEIGGIVTAQSGSPATPAVTGIIGSNTGRPVRPNCIGDPKLPAGQRSINRFWNLSALAPPPDYTYGTCGKNFLRGPDLVNWDFSLRKDFPFLVWGDLAGLEFRAEMFNWLNHPSFGMPQTNISDPTFGTITSLAEAPREIQFALRLHW